ncbi:MAG: methyltransferase family protein [Xanthobacteraceae bacterium]
MWLREPVLILTIAVAALGLLFAIRRVLGATSATSSDGAVSNPEASRGNAGVVAPPPVIFLGFLALAAVLEALVPSPTATLFPYARYVAGAVLFIIGFLVGIAGLRGLRAVTTNISTDLPTTALAVDGIYRRSRNPLYLAMTLVYLGLAIAAGSAWAIALLIPLLIMMHVGVIFREEGYLEREFGDAYRQYKSHVRRWL